MNFGNLIEILARKKSLSILSVVVFGVLLILFSFGGLSLNDFYWHLAIGKWMFATKSLLKHEIFAFAFQGKEWLNNTWLFDGVLYLIYDKSGFLGLNTLRFIVFAATYWFLFKAITVKRKLPMLLILACFILTIGIIRNFYRPEIAGPMFIAYFLYMLYSYKYRQSKLLWTLPPVAALWTNVHGSFTLAIILVGIFFGSELIRAFLRNPRHIESVFQKNAYLKKYLVIFILTCGATLINPYGYRIYKFTSIMLRDVETLSNIQEWRPVPFTDFLSITFDNRVSYVVFVWIATILIAFSASSLLGSRLRSARRSISFLPLEDIALLAIALVSTMQYVRGAHTLGIIATVVMLRGLGGHAGIRRFLENKPIISLALFALVLSQHTYNNDAPTLNIATNKAATDPHESIEYVLSNAIQGNYINEYADGGSLIWLLYPRYHVFMDGRSANVYDARYYWYYRNLPNEKIFDLVVKRNNITFAIVRNGWDITGMLEKKDWKLVFFDNTHAIYLAPVAANEELRKNAYTFLKPTIGEETIKEICKNPEQREKLTAEIARNINEVHHPLRTYSIASQLATSCNGSQEELMRAEAYMRAAITKEPENGLHYYNLGTIELKLGKDGEALKSFNHSVRTGKNKQNLTGLGIALHNLGRYTEAEKIFRSANRAAGNFPPEYYQIYARVSYQIDKNEQAVDFFHRYIDLTGEENATAQDYTDLSNAYHDAGDAQHYEEYRLKADQVTSITTDDAV